MSTRPTNNNIVPLHDDDPMPFGKHKGLRMSEVPVEYLHYLWSNGKQFDKTCRVAAYIRANLSILETENEDLIWE